MRHETVWHQMIRNDVLGPKAAADTKRMIFAGEEYLRIMSSGVSLSAKSAALTPMPPAPLNVENIGNAQAHYMDKNKERAELQRGLAPHFSLVLECILIGDMTIAETSQKIESANDERTKERIKERFRNALIQLAFGYFKLGSR